MKVLVTGGAGFIESNLVALLLREWCSITVSDSLVILRRENLRMFAGVALEVGDLRDSPILRKAANDAELIFHFAASSGNTRTIHHPRVDAEINVMGMLNAFETASEFGVRGIVFSSSARIFGGLNTLPISQSHPVDPDSPYGASKLGSEKLSLSKTKLYPPFEAVCLRYFNVFGVNQRFDAYGNVIPVFTHNLVSRGLITIFGDGEQTRDFINVADLARSNLLAGGNRRVSGAFNRASGTRITINELVAQMLEVSGLDTEVVYGPPRDGRCPAHPRGHLGHRRGSGVSATRAVWCAHYGSIRIGRKRPCGLDGMLRADVNYQPSSWYGL